MAKDRNTFEKHRRELEKKRKADEKRKRRATRKLDADDPTQGDGALSQSEHSVLRVFRDYQMTPGKMLCFSGPDLDVLGPSLSDLAGKGLLVKEGARGRYSLTDRGFAAMRDSA